MAKETTEIGHGSLTALPWSSFSDALETVPDLVWPRSIRVYNNMRNDAQIASMLLALTLPIQRYKWSIDPNGARDEVTQFVASNFNLPIRGAEEQVNRRRTRDRFNFVNHLRNALLSLVYGHMYFEQVYRYQGEDRSRLMLHKLAERMPLTISDIKVDRDGGLQSIIQHPTGWEPGQTMRNLAAGQQGLIIPVDKLTAYIHDQEGGNWRGVSVLRRAYKNFIIKDKLLRIDVVRHERTGAGVPIIEAHPNATKTEIEALNMLAQRYRAGEAAGGAIPYGAKLRLMGVEGSTPDTIESARYHDQQISRGVLAMFLDLGTTASGSRALGDSSTDFFSLSQETIATAFANTTNEHVIEDLVDKNWENEENVPLLVFDRDDDLSSSVVDLVALVNSGLLEVDEGLRSNIRERYKLPAASEVDPDDTSAVPAAPKLQVVAASHRDKPIQVHLAEGDTPEVGNRDPFDYEEEAGSDFGAIDAAFVAALLLLLNRWKEEVRPRLVSDLIEQIEAIDPDDEVAFANLQATPIGDDVIREVVDAYAAQAAEQAQDEARFQGAAVPEPDLDNVSTLLAVSAAAMVAIIAKWTSEIASRTSIAFVGAGLTAAEIGDEVQAHLDGLSDSYTRDQLGGLVSAAQGAARAAVFSEGSVDHYRASEILDPVTCTNCRPPHDGKRYETLEDALVDYPKGYYKRCKGRTRCRGLVIAIYKPEEA